MPQEHVVQSSAQLPDSFEACPHAYVMANVPSFVKGMDGNVDDGGLETTGVGALAKAQSASTQKVARIVEGISWAPYTRSSVPKPGRRR